MDRIEVMLIALVCVFGTVFVLVIIGVWIRIRLMHKGLVALAKQRGLVQVLARRSKSLPFFEGQHAGYTYLVTEVFHKLKTFSGVHQSTRRLARPYTRILMGKGIHKRPTFQLFRRHFQTKVNESFEDNFPLSKSFEGILAKTQKQLMNALDEETSIAIRFQHRDLYGRVHLPSDTLLPGSIMVLMFDVDSKSCSAQRLTQVLEDMGSILDTLDD